ncbi:hypothetical protein DOTSEDRAFT_68663 [Dothistroma septosporum NZE10]|uniref:3-phytase n=1 Tax=Dothistroma septosporum (strain NZE10 / CBS 128990) TaxID=675120 RepID=N1Q517_DOTSN|nr:hypothetical protein DOTSEDRAFT_68663 [Dothistroma septosporum NZE10]
MLGSRSALALLALGGVQASVGQKKGSSSNQTLLTDINAISQYWGQISTYRDNPASVFDVQDVGLPDGCQIEQAHTLQRHAQRFPTSAFDDGANDERFAQKVLNFTKANPNATFNGPLSFLKHYEYRMGESYLTNIGAQTEFASGVQFWNQYGRLLYNATVGQVQYNGSYTNGTARPKPVLRTTGQSRIENSQISWALGFFGPSFYEIPEPKLSAFGNGSLFDVVIIPEGGTENNTLASYDSCFRDDVADVGYIGDNLLFYKYVPRYLGAATARLQKYVPDGLKLNVNDTYAMQSICAYENGYIGTSDFCNLFTVDEWAGFEQTLDIEYYYDYAWGNPTGRAQGLGYQQELLARLTKQYITSSNSSVNSTLDNNAQDFPLNRPFYADFTHDDIIVSTLTAMSVDYYRDHPNVSTYPPDPDRHFILSRLTPFGARLFTEVIGCAESNPEAQHSSRTQYYPTQYGYNPANATHKFIRMRLNNGIVPLDTIRGGKCSGRTDGLCAMDNFLASQYESMKLANYDFACFANYTLNNATNANDYDGTVTNRTAGITIHPGMYTADNIANFE